MRGTDYVSTSPMPAPTPTPCTSTDPQRLSGRGHRRSAAVRSRSARQFIYEFEPDRSAATSTTATSTPLKRHIHKGLYGAYIVNPDPAKQGDAAKARHPDYAESEEWQELVMVMNAFDTNFDAEQRGLRGQLGRLPLYEAPHRDRPRRGRYASTWSMSPSSTSSTPSICTPISSTITTTGTQLEPTLRTVDTIIAGAGAARHPGVLLQGPEPGHYMFHAHVSEFAELGWMRVFDVR